MVEVRSPKDETYLKLPFYAAVGAREVLVLHPESRSAELYRPVDGEMVADSGDELRSEVLGISLRTVDGKLRITWADGSAEI